MWAKEDYFTDEEIAVIVEEAHHVGRRVATHARSTESCAKAVRHGIDILYHMTYIDDATMDLLEQRKDSVFVASIGEINGLLEVGFLTDPANCDVPP